MAKLTNHVIVDAPAEAVWEVVAHRFDRIGEWATAIPSSAPSAPQRSAVDAPVAGRVCRTGIRMVPEAAETVVAYDEAGRTLTYEATAGMPAFITGARNRWEVTALGSRRARVAFEAQIEVRGLLGRLTWWLLVAQAGRTGRYVLDDLKHYVEHTEPSPRKQRQLSRAAARAGSRPAGPVVDADTPGRLAAQRLRNTLRLNAGFSTLTGVVLVAAPDRVAGVIGTGHPGWLRLVGAGLVLFAGDVAGIAGARLRRLLACAPAVIVADLAWVAATVGTVAAGWFDHAGIPIAAGAGVVVGGFAWRQSVHWRRTRALTTGRLDGIDETPPIEVFHTAAPVPAPARDVWDTITDHDLYARLAPNLSAVRALTDNGPDLVRTCSNTKGQSWTETCTLWDEGRRFDVDVRTDDYPYPLQIMRGSWWVEPDGPQRSIAGMDFLLQPRPGLRGRLFAIAMQAGFTLILRRILRGWRVETVRRSASDSRVLAGGGKRRAVS